MAKKKESVEQTVRNIRRKTRKQYSVEEKIRIVLEGLKANLSSSGDLRYRGNPTVEATTSSTGDVIPIGE